MTSRLASLRTHKDAINVVIYHDPCQDGLSAAWVAHHYFKNTGRQMEDIRFIGLDAGAALYLPPEVYTGMRVLILDVLPRNWQDIISATEATIILDHHRTNVNKVGLDAPFAWFDMARSGTGLAWEYFYPDVEAPAWLKYIEQRDLGQLDYTNNNDETSMISKAFCEGLSHFTDAALSLKEKFDVYDILVDVTNPDKARIFMKIIEDFGAVIYRKKMVKIQQLVAKALIIDCHIGNRVYKIAKFNCSDDCRTELGNYACACMDIDFSMCWYLDHSKSANTLDINANPVYYSLRSRGDRTDVAAITAAFGGGGHKNAAGFWNSIIFAIH